MIFTKRNATFERIAAGRTDLVFDYVGQGKPATARDSDGASLLYYCARYGDVSAMRFLLAQGERLDSISSRIDLEGAAYFGHWRLCEFLLENGADVNRPNPETGETPLHAALCTANRPAFELVVRVLLAANADPNRQTKPGVPTGAFMRDCRTKGETPLHRAAAFAPESTIRLLLKAGAAKNTTDIDGDSPLGWASWHTRPDSILRLLTYDDFYVRPDRGSTFDHGTGWGEMEVELMGRPLT
ncbi:MAG: ankyrin repeat domain-containing protein [Gemmatimonadaceae bacterium]